jgi:hypothetical protein
MKIVLPNYHKNLKSHQSELMSRKLTLQICGIQVPHSKQCCLREIPKVLQNF